MNTWPQVGDGATMCLHSDRHAFTVIKVSPSGKTITCRRDRAIGTGDGMSQERTYTYRRDSSGETIKARRGKDGRFRLMTGTPYRPVVVEGRHEHYDPHF